jgi:hypothetical protein
MKCSPNDLSNLNNLRLGIKLSNGHSPANLSNSSTRQNGHFGKLVGLDTFADIGHPTLPGLDTFTRHSPTIFPGLDTFAKGKFGNFYTNLVNLASLANLASVD